MTNMIAVILVTCGVALLIYSGVTFKTTGIPLAMAPVQVKTAYSFFNLIVAGVIALVGGVTLLVSVKHIGFRKTDPLN